MITLTENILIQIVAFSAYFAPYLMMLFFMVYRCIQKREKRKHLAYLRSPASKANDFSLNDFEGDNANLSINNNYGGNNKEAVEVFQKVIERLYKEKDEQAEIIAAQSEVIDSLRDELHEYKFYNSPNLFKLIESHENKLT